MELFRLIVLSFLEVLVFGVLLGAGLPALIAWGVRIVASTSSLRETDFASGTWATQVFARLFAYALFVLVGVIIVVGIAVIVAAGMGAKVPF